MSSLTRLQCIAVSFAKHYYTTLVQDPELLLPMYVHTAIVEHVNRQASGHHNIRELLSATVYQEAVEGAKVNTVTSTCAPSGTVLVTVSGVLHMRKSQPFIQEFALREHKENTFAIVSDKLRYVAAVQGAPTANWAAQSPQVAPQAEVESVPPMANAVPGITPAAGQEASVPAASLPQDHQQPGASADTETEPEQPPAPSKPLSFAAALRLKSTSNANGIISSDAVVRVTAPAAEKTADEGLTTGKKATEEVEKAEKGDKKDRRRTRVPLVFFDIIVKGLPAGAKEEDVRAVLGDAAVRLVKVESRSDKKDPSITRTFAFVQLDHEVLKAAQVSVKDAVSKVIAASQKRKVGKSIIEVEEVRDKRAAAAASAN